MDSTQAAQLSNEHRTAFVLAGHAKFTVVSKRTGKRFTYRVLRANNGLIEGAPKGSLAPELWYVSALVGSDNTSDYAYLGTIDRHHTFKLTTKSRYPWGTPCVDAFYWVWENLDGHQADQFEFWHAGTCGRCGRDLTDPESIKCGLGPVCREKG